MVLLLKIGSLIRKINMWIKNIGLGSSNVENWPHKYSLNFCQNFVKNFVEPKRLLYFFSTEGINSFSRTVKSLGV